MNNNMLKAALRYAENGLPVVPFWWIKSDGTCACGKGNCKRGKHPIIAGWQKNASADAAQVTAWWTKNPYANIGVLCDERSGWLVLDVDAGHGGTETLAELERRYGVLPDTVTQETGGGGHAVTQDFMGSVMRNYLCSAMRNFGKAAGDLTKSIVRETFNAFFIGGVFPGMYDRFVATPFNPYGNFWGW